MKYHSNAVHDGQKNYKYGTCEKSFSQAGDLKMHVNSVHNGQKDHKCDSCGKASSSARVLKKHINSVHKVQKCDTCVLLEKMPFHMNHIYDLFNHNELN